MKIDDFIRCFRVKYDSKSDDDNLDDLFSFVIERINDEISEDDDESNKENQKPDKQEKNNKTSYMVNQEKYDRILHCLQKPDECDDANFKHWVLKKSSINIIENKLYRTQTKGPKNAKISVNVPVCPMENFFDVCYRVHSIERGHVGVIKSD